MGIPVPSIDPSPERCRIDRPGNIMGISIAHTSHPQQKSHSATLDTYSSHRTHDTAAAIALLKSWAEADSAKRPKPGQS
jgi:hypothetical protein